MKTSFIFLALLSFNVEAAQVTRHANLTVSVVKHIYSARDGGVFDETPVCQSTASIEVVDATKNEQPQEPFYKIDCPSTLNGEAVDVLVGGVLQLDADLKWIQLGMWVDPDSDEHKLQTYNVNYSVDLGSKRSVAVLQPYVDVDCEPSGDSLQCTPTKLKEYFSVRAQIDDTP